MAPESPAPDNSNSLAELDAETQAELDQEAQRVAWQLKQEAVQRQQEKRDSEQIDQQLDLIHEKLKATLATGRFDHQTQRELGILLQLIPNIREQNSRDTLWQLETAISALVGNIFEADPDPRRNGDRSVSQPLSNTHSNPKHNKLANAVRDFFFVSEGRPENFPYAQRIRKGIQYQVSSKSSKSTYLIGGLATFLFLLGAVPLYFFYRSDPPTIRIRPKSLSEIEIVSGERQVRIIAEREELVGQSEPEDSEQTFISGESPVTINFLDPGELKQAIAPQAAEISERIITEIERDLTDELRRSVRRTLSQSLARAYNLSEASVPASSIDGVVESVSTNIIDTITTDLGENLDDSTQAELEEAVSNSLSLEEDEIRDLIEEMIRNTTIDNENQTPSREDFLILLQEEQYLPSNFGAGTVDALLDSASVREISQNAVEEALTSFPFDDLTTLEQVSVTQSSGQSPENPAVQGGESDSPGSDNSLFDDSLEDLGIDWRYLLIVIAGGSFGGSTFIVLKAQDPNTYINEDRFSLFFTGLLKPISGVALALFLFAALQSNALPVSLKTTQADNSQNAYLFFALSFVAGFSQLLVQDTISKTQTSVLPSSVGSAKQPASRGTTE